MEFFLGYETYNISVGAEDSTFNIDLAPLEIQDFQKLLKYIASANKNASEEEAAQEGLEKMSDDKLKTLFKEFLPKYCQNIQGIDIIVKKEPKETRNATIEDLLKYGIFFTYSFNILVKLFSISSLAKEEEMAIKK